MFTNVYSTKDIKDISEKITSDFPDDAGGCTVNVSAKNHGESTIYELQEDIAELGMQISFQNSIIRSLSTRLRKLEDSLPLIGI